MRAQATIFALLMAGLPGVAAADATMEALPPVPVFEPLYAHPAARPAKTAAPRSMVSNTGIAQPARAIPPAPALVHYLSPATSTQPSIPTPVAPSFSPKPTNFVQRGPELADGASFVLPGNTAIALRLRSSLSSRESRRGDSVQLIVDHDIMLDGRIVVPRGTPATGEIVRSSGSGGFGKGGKIEIAATSLMLNGRAVELSGSLLTKGRGGSAGKMLLFGALSGAMGLASVRGDDAVIGPEVTIAATTRADVAFK